MKLPAVAVLVTLLIQPAAAETIALSDVSHIHGVALDPATPGAVLPATHYGLYRATPDGKAETASANADDFMGFSPDPANSGRLLASGHPAQGGNLGVIVSEDGGANWTKLSDGASGPVDFHAMTISRADPKVIYGTYAGIQMSRDGGLSWVVMGPDPEQLIDLAASPNVADTLYAGTARGLMRSNDAGRSWTPFGPSAAPATMVKATANGSVYAFLAVSRLFRLPPEGIWAELTAKFGERNLLHLAADPADAAHLVAITEESAVLESGDGGWTWTAFRK